MWSGKHTHNPKKLTLLGRELVQKGAGVFSPEEIIPNPFLSYEKSKRKKPQTHSPKDIKQYLRNYYHTQLHIRRLFYPNDLIPIAEHYVLLSILSSDTHQLPLAGSEAQGGEKSEDVYEVSTRMYGHSVSIMAPENLMPVFQSPCARRVEVLGTAGIGKSTLSERLCYLWTLSGLNRLAEEYDWVFRLPLRNLTPERYPEDNECDVLTLIEQECLAPAMNKTGFFLSQRDKAALGIALSKATQQRRVLLVLDGFDEIDENMPDYLKAVLRTLLEFGQLVVTSRPYNLAQMRQAYGFSATCSYEITGFSPAQIDCYVRDFFRYLPVSREEEAEVLLGFLKQNPSVAGICRIPINLELFCSAWEKQRIPQGHYSLTTIYETVTLSLCRRYLEREGEIINNVDDNQVLRRCKQPLTFLEHVGYNSAGASKLFFNITDSCDYLRAHLNNNQIARDDDFVLEQKSFGFIRPNNPKGEYDGASLYYFNHLTFRDYFAARFLLRCLQGMRGRSVRDCYFSHVWPASESVSLEHFLQQKRFDPQYELISWFMTGMLGAMGDILSLKYWLSLLLADGDKSELGRFLLLIRVLDETTEIQERLPAGLWAYVEKWLALFFEPFFSLLLLHNQSRVIALLKISPSVLGHNAVQSFFDEKIQVANATALRSLLGFFCQLGLALPLRLEKALWEKYIRLKFETTLPESMLHHQLIRCFAALYRQGCLSLDLLKERYRSAETTEEVRTAIQVMFLYANSAPSDEITPAALSQTLYGVFLDSHQPLSLRLIGASAVGTFYEFAVFLLLERDQGRYREWDLSAFFAWDAAKGAIHFTTGILSQHALIQGSCVDLQLFVLLQKIGIEASFAPFFEPIILSKDSGLEKQLTAFSCWLSSLKKMQTPQDLANLPALLHAFDALLKNAALEDVSGGFLELLSELFSPAPFLVFTTFAQVREQLTALFITDYPIITAPTIKRYLALSLSCYATVPDNQYAELLNTIINHAYSDLEIIKLCPRLLASGPPPQLVLVTELAFCRGDCTPFLEQLNIGEKTHPQSLFLLLNKTPTRAVLNFSVRLLRRNNQVGFQRLMEALLWRYLSVGRAFYFNEEGLCYFEGQKYHVFPLEIEDRVFVEEALNQGVKSAEGASLPTLSAQLQAQWAAPSQQAHVAGKDSKKKKQKKKNKSRATASNNDMPSVVINNNNHFNPTEKTQKTTSTSITNSAVALNNSKAINSIGEGGYTFPSRSTTPPTQPSLNSNHQGDMIMPVNKILPTHFEYSVMSDYGYLDADSESRGAILAKLGEGWEVRDCPNGQLDSGYVGAVFLHEARKQIVIAHAGTLPTRVKTFLADARGVVGAGADPLLLDALMRTHGKNQVTLKSLAEEEGYRLSFTGHSLGGFLAEMSVYACHRGFGLHYPEASAVVFDSPGSLEVMEAWQSHIGQHHVDLKQLNIIAFLSSPNLVNTVNSHPGTVYRLLRDIPLSTFESYLLASHDRKKMFALFNPETGFPNEESWVEMEDWPLADYEELLSLKDHPVSGALDLAVIKPVQFISGLAQNVWGFLARSPSKVSPTRLFGGEEPRQLWELLTSQTAKHYHLLFDVATREGLSHALQTHYIVKNKVPASLMQRVPLVNVSPVMLAFLEFHEQRQRSALYQDYVKNFGLDFSLLPYHVDRKCGYLYLSAPIGSEMVIVEEPKTIRAVVDELERLLRQVDSQAAIREWGQYYVGYVEDAIKETGENILVQQDKLKEQDKKAVNNKALVNKLQGQLITAEKRLVQLSKEFEELKVLQEEACNQKSNGGNFSLIMGAAVAKEEGSKAENEIRMSEEAFRKENAENRRLVEEHQKRLMEHPDYVLPKNQEYVVNAAVAKKSDAEAKNKIILNNNTNASVIDSTEGLSEAPSEQFSFSKKKEELSRYQQSSVLLNLGLFSPIDSRIFIRKAENYYKTLQSHDDTDIIEMSGELNELLMVYRQNLKDKKMPTQADRDNVRKKIDDIESLKLEILKTNLPVSP